MDCIDDDSAVKAAARRVDSHHVEFCQLAVPLRFDAWSKEMSKTKWDR
jgi:hypothetical protein